MVKVVSPAAADRFFFHLNLWPQMCPKNYWFLQAGVGLDSDVQTSAHLQTSVHNRINCYSASILFTFYLALNDHLKGEILLGVGRSRI